MLWLIPVTPPALAADTTEEPVADDVEEVIVYSDLRHRTDQETTSSTTVIDEAAIDRRAATHLEEVLATAPNVNFASGSSRARFIQIRGIGERSQFVEPLNPSVGLIVDGIDMTGLGTGAGLIDAQQVEILRGPQGTVYGANALAGLINITTHDPKEDWGAEGMIGVANYDTLEARAKANMPLADNFGVRLAVSHLQSDGFFTNETLDRDDTMGRNETLVRAKALWEPLPDLQVRFTGFHSRTDNGYDAFNFDNDRITLSDDPGEDDQNTTGLGLGLTWSSPIAVLEARTSLALSDLTYSYDEDWTYDGYHDWGYTSKDTYTRDVAMASTDIRLLSGEDGKLFGDRTDWVVGVFTYDKRVELLREYTYADEDFESRNRVVRWAAYGESTTRFDNPLALTVGIRGERHQIDYSDNTGVEGDPGEWLWGGKLSAAWETDPATAYILVSRGYKSGGFNANPLLPDDLKSYATEALWNYELGAKASWLDGRSRAKASVFYQDRRRVQSNGSYLIEREDGSTEFIDYTENAALGFNTGVELEADVQLIPEVRAYGSVGLLETRLLQPDATYDGRQQAHAPLYQGVVGARADVDLVFGGVELEAKDAFYFSPRHDEKSTAYALVNAHLGFRPHESIELQLWTRNLNNATVYTRGFGSFGNDPANEYTTEPYYQLGEPRVFGARLTGRL